MVHAAVQKRLAVYKTKAFTRFARKAHIDDADLWESARRAERGLIDADLGGGVIKQRIARPGEGKSGGTRSIILFRFKGRAVFVYGFEKKDLGNIKSSELEAFRELADVILGYSDVEIATRVVVGVLIEVLPPKEDQNGQKVS
jgi:hypothetical protein